MRKRLLFILIALLMLAACSEDNGGSGKTVNVAGVWLDNTELTLKLGHIETATLSAMILPSDATNQKVQWKSNNEKVATVKDGVVTAVAKGNAIVTATTEDGGKTADCYVTVVLADIYLVGNMRYTANYAKQAVLWMNDYDYPLEDKGSAANSIYVRGNDVYVAGYMGGSSPRATVWTNGNSDNSIRSTDISYAESIQVAGGYVYVAGCEAGKAMLWQNNMGQTLSNVNSHAYSVYVAGDNEYVAGEVNDGSGAKAALWTNGTQQILCDNESYAYSVHASEGDVYVAGNIVDESRVVEERYSANPQRHGVNRRLCPCFGERCIRGR